MATPAAAGLQRYGAARVKLAWILESSLMQLELWETDQAPGQLHLHCPARPIRLEFDAAVPTSPSRRARTLSAPRGRYRRGRFVDACCNRHRRTPILTTNSAWWPTSPWSDHTTVFTLQWFRRDGIWPGCRCPASGSQWSGPTATAAVAPNSPVTNFAHAVADAGGGQLGRFEGTNAGGRFPLRLMRAPRSQSDRGSL